jgi:hypothetical protein
MTRGLRIAITKSPQIEPAFELSDVLAAGQTATLRKSFP